MFHSNEILGNARGVVRVTSHNQESNFFSKVDVDTATRYRKRKAHEICKVSSSRLVYHTPFIVV